MSDTPRTDAAIALTSQYRYDDSFGDPEFGWVTAGFARTLERDLAAAQLTIARQQQELDASCNAEELRQVRVELAALREDKARLDWLLANCSSFVAEDFTTGNRDLYNIDATTEAIDKAIAERKEKKL